MNFHHHTLLPKHHIHINLFVIMICAVVFFGLPTATAGQTFSNTLSLPVGHSSPVADLSAVSWVQGHWCGQAFGGITEEVWSPPLGGSMMCAFKLVVNQRVKFYELATITEEDSTLVLRLKHFHSNLKGWEEKDTTIDFRLVNVSGNRVYFDGFTFERVDEKNMNIYVVIESKSKSEEVKFSYTKSN